MNFLRRAFKKLKADLDKSADYEALPDDGRMAAAIDLTAVVSFLKNSGISGPAHDRLRRLAIALYDLDNGVIADMLKPEPLVGRKPDSTERLIAKGCAAAAMDALMQPHADGSKGASKEEAARRVARAIGNTSSQTVAYWRDTANHVNNRENFDATAYFTFKRCREKYRTPGDQVFNMLVRKKSS